MLLCAVHIACWLSGRKEIPLLSAPWKLKVSWKLCFCAQQSHHKLAIFLCMQVKGVGKYVLTAELP